MKRALSITNKFEKIELKAREAAQADFTVTNETDRRMEVELRLQAKGKASDWFNIEGGATRAMEPRATELVSVSIKVPPKEAAQSVNFSLNAASVEDPDDVFCAGPSAALMLPPVEVKKRKIPWILIIGLVLVVAAATAFAIHKAGQAKEAAAWKKAETENSIAEYESYLKNFPGGEHFALAQAKLAEKKQQEAEATAWQKALKANSIAEYESYIKNFPGGEHFALAQTKLAEKRRQEAEAARALEEKRKRDKDIADWNAAKSKDTIASYNDYIQNNPRGLFISQARDALDSKFHPGGTFRVNNTAWFNTRFYASWDQKQSNGGYAAKTWEITLMKGQDSSMAIPQGSRNIKIGANGVGYGSVFEVTNPDLSKTYTVYGTLFGAGLSTK